MGGFATLHFGLNMPHKAISLTIAGCGYGAIPLWKKDQSDGFTKESEKNAEEILKSGIKIFGNKYGLGPTRVQYQNKDYKGWEIFNKRLINHDPLGSANTLLGVQSKRPNLYELETLISEINIPTLIINGDEDDMCLEVGIYLKRLIKTSGLTIIPKSGHTINLEEPALFNQHLTNFYQSIENNSWVARDLKSNNCYKLKLISKIYILKRKF